MMEPVGFANVHWTGNYKQSEYGGNDFQIFSATQTSYLHNEALKISNPMLMSRVAHDVVIPFR